ncbi:OLC1v1003750C1 [Oldenlandia corymbosa var. corymbosa]|uniref:OLC1v1003750C1 n=1 Tax=Oldenlandia corymbosa var. corymbosa TaxID=529605 RepID=A0AAV1DAQ2_OLDCO|nr:OLC1v1003750C1 [Oldenlandia corymbosa var. corymbosa]
MEDLIAYRIIYWFSFVKVVPDYGRMSKISKVPIETSPVVESHDISVVYATRTLIEGFVLTDSDASEAYQRKCRCTDAHDFYKWRRIDDEPQKIKEESPLQCPNQDLVTQLTNNTSRIFWLVT